MKKWPWVLLFLFVGVIAPVERGFAQTPKLVAAVLPASRAIVVNATATAFATIINTGATTAQGCAVRLPASVPAIFSYQTTNPATNALTGSPNTPASIPPGSSQTFVFSIRPTATFAQTDIALQFSCTTGETAASITGVNTFLLTASAQATPDIVALAATVSNDGIVRTPGTTAIAAFSVATVNVGVGGTVVASVDPGSISLPATFAICQTNAQAVCQQPPAAAVTTSFSANQTGTFSIFVTSTGTVIPLNPANARVFVRFRSQSNASFGATSVAVQTQITLAEFGGTLQLGPVKISASAGSVVSGTDFSASTTSVPASPPPGFASLNSAYGVTLTNALGAPDHGLNAPINVTVPYSGLGVNDPKRLTVLHYDNAAGIYAPATIQNIDTTAQTITFDSRQFSSFVLAALNATLPTTASAPSFAPNLNGFQITNVGNQYLTPGGNCLGMSSFALWYYTLRGAGLYTAYPVANRPASIQDLVAVRAHINQSWYWNNLYQDANSMPWQRSNPDAVQFLLRGYLALFRVPVVVIVGTSGSPAAHAVLFYGYDANNFQIYDPNHPAVVTTLPYNSGGFGSYDGWTRFAFIGSPSFGGADNFAQLATEADGGFTFSQNLTITNPQPNATISSRQTQLTGFSTGSLSGQKVIYWQNGLSGFKDIGTSPFNQTIDVASGQNTVVVLTGVRAYGTSVSNTLANAAAKIVAFNGPPSAKFRATLNWNQDNSDVDQYVTEPTGATAWWASKTTTAGLRLDFDNTAGFGPENTTIEAVSTPIAGVYKVRVHYYSDKGTGQAVAGRVTITVNERGSNQVGPLTKQWALSVSSSHNDSPGSTGPDWIDIADVNVVSGTITLK